MSASGILSVHSTAFEHDIFFFSFPTLTPFTLRLFYFHSFFSANLRPTLVFEFSATIWIFLDDLEKQIRKYFEIAVPDSLLKSGRLAYEKYLFSIFSNELTLGGKSDLEASTSIEIMSNHRVIALDFRIRILDFKHVPTKRIP